MNALASSSTSRSLCSSLGVVRISRRAYPSTSSSSSSSSTAPSSSSPPSASNDASTSTSSSYGLDPPTRTRKPKWTRAQLLARDYESAGLPPSSPNHELIFAPIKRKKQRQQAENRRINEENALRDSGGKARADGSRWLSSEEFELKVYKEQLAEKKKKLALDEMLGTGAIARKRWAWEWFREGKELEDIGKKMATLADPPRSHPYPAPRMVEWILTHLSRPPRDASVTSSFLAAPSTTLSTSSDDGRPLPTPSRSKYINSLHLLTPFLWDRLTKAHPSWAGYSYQETIGTHLENDAQANMALFDLLWRKGWRGEGLVGEAVVETLRTKEVEERTTSKTKNSDEDDASNDEEGRAAAANDPTTVAETRSRLRMMWDKAGEDCPLPGEILRSYLSLPAPASENVDANFTTSSTNPSTAGWGTAEDLSIPQGSEEELHHARQDQLRLARKADQLRSLQAKGGPASLSPLLPSAFASALARLPNKPPPPPSTAFPPSPRGVGVASGVPETVKIAELLAVRDEARRVAAEGGEEAIKKREREFKKRLGGMDWWAAKHVVKVEKRRVGEEEERREREGWGERGLGMAGREGKARFGFVGPEGSSPWKQ